MLKKHLLLSTVVLFNNFDETSQDSTTHSLMNKNFNGIYLK